ncbi:hypothetical protein [Desulforamulus aeronauticus]|uniref:Uncharacterized protein n=1 Tax=Desulforamulus aeronauticus DSM 10349 TaxID=1121421 RepID=A0A1M6TZ42_9FIRM|nr:hypothetical protein [Desulforamulus aeronauticus]SHK62227.1 hypothetical protein SAMN02745123_02521 [Desulforamulus aeronauticus DSM 10349]
MDFKEALLERTREARKQIEAYEKSLDVPRRQYRHQFALVMQTKNLINQIFNTVVQYFPNAETELTHSVDEKTGEICPLMWTSSCCILNFASNTTYRFPVPTRFAIKILVANNLLNVNLVSGYSMGHEAIKKDAKSYHTVLKQLQYNGNSYYNGPYNEEEIKSATEREILRLLDTYQEKVKLF